MAKITILGLGLIGTSIGLALKRSKQSGLRVTGHDREPTSSRSAQKMGAVDSVEWNIGRAVRDADLVVIATPALAIKEVMQHTAEHLPEECVVTDTCSTKTRVLQWAKEILPSHVSFVGGHPLAGKEESGPGAAEAGLFDGATYCVIPGAGAASWAVQAVVSLVEIIGAKPFFIDAGEHDSFVAAVSHLPITISAALVASTTKSPSWHEMARLAANGYRDITRLASGDPEMNRDICLTNASELTPWLDRVITELLELRRNLEESNDEEVARFFAHVYEEREKWLAGVSSAPTGAPDVSLPGATEQLGALFMGELLARKSREMLKQYDERAEGGKKRWRR
ncbi:MAG: prephenate dehydrogenase/arogenate dehydrogenase family protein [Dehalococcoidia bacterium]